jgi:thiol-disulfide isomerase/thioredoxin
MLLTVLALLMMLALAVSDVPAAATTGTKPATLEGRRAPALIGSDWLNSKPLTRADLAGKVVLVEFWTFECINCRRTVPAMKRLHERFAPGKDVVIVGVHTPELPQERDGRAVQRAIDTLRLPYPVLLDNAMANWNAFDNQYWPALYIIDRHGTIKLLHIGELHEGTEAWRSVVALIESLRRERA